MVLLATKKIDKTKKTIILRMAGGLGNQLWEYAYACHMKKIYAADEILLDIRGYKTEPYREFELFKLNLPDYVYILSSEENELVFDLLNFFYSKIRGLIFKLRGFYIENKLNFYYKNGYYITHNTPLSGILTPKNKIWLRGYFQNIENIRDQINDMRLLLNINTELLSDEYRIFNEYIITSENPVAVSYRCGNDYEKIGWNICTDSYYKKALSMVNGNNVFVFSDNIEKARKKFPNASCDAIFIPQLSPIEQLLLMSKCKSFILANSTFCYWAALLSEHQEKVVYYPEWWFPYLKTEDAAILYDNNVVVK